ncbi:MAG: cobalamin B12-binding domain-containing protein [Candidatus Helarchaeota archaeon]
MRMMNLIEDLKNSIINGDSESAVKIAKEIVDNEYNIQDAILNGLSAGMKIVSKRYENHEYFIPEVIVSADALNSAFNIFKPHLEEKSKAAGYKIIDLGRNVPAEKFVEAVEKYNADIVALSTLMSPTLEQMQIVIEKLKENGLRNKVKVIIGGAPTDEDFMRKIGADFCCKDAVEAVSVLDNTLIKKKAI